jgi:hypothetical protein
MKLDIHTHILPDDLPDLNEKFGYPGLSQIIFIKRFLEI